MASALFWRSKRRTHPTERTDHSGPYAQANAPPAEKRGPKSKPWSFLSTKKKKDATRSAAAVPAGWHGPPPPAAVSRTDLSAAHGAIFSNTLFASSYIHSPAPPARRTFASHSALDFSAPPAACWDSTDSFDLPEPEDEDDPAVHVRLGDFRSRAKLTCQSVLSLGKKTVALGLRKGSRAEGLRSDVWTVSYSTEIFDMSVPPPVPARSRLRDAPPPRIDTSRDARTAASSPRPDVGNPSPNPDTSAPAMPPSSPSPLSPYFRKASLQVDHVNLPATPRLNSPSTPSFTFASSSLASPSNTGPLSSFARKRQSKLMDKDPRDPYKVKDGVLKKKASSGIYTPPTFPGPSGDHLHLPQQSTSTLYTPPTHILDAPGQSAGLGLGPMSPSLSSSTRSSSSDHSDSTAPPHTPISPTGRFGKAFSSNVRRLSSMAALSGMTSPSREREEEREREEQRMKAGGSEGASIAGSGSGSGSGGWSWRGEQSRKGSAHSHSYSHTFSYYPSGTPSLESGSSCDPHSSLEHYANPQPLVSSPASISTPVSSLTPTHFYTPSSPSSPPSTAPLGVGFNVEEEPGDGMEGAGNKVSRQSPRTRGRRKPVPRLLEEEDSTNLVESMEGLQVGL
ncbi:hypothetical protein C359_03296 [Cryptococcus neoformans Bt120]|nr:hypothetical protein C359_03296 [Cryptococcus neoformans var. grubii Bt120]